MNERKVAIMMTCHNRKEKTLLCLDSLFRCKLPDGVKLQLFLADDGSTDGTGELVKARFPDAKILVGSGNLFWSGGMRLAFDGAAKNDFDYYLWLNDDTYLDTQALLSLLAVQQVLFDETGQEGIAVGTTHGSCGLTRSYGGLVRKGFWHPLGFDLVRPAGHCIRCHTMEGNCVLISRKVVDCIGWIDERFIHGMGDIDYGFRANKAGLPLGVAADFVGVCDINSELGTYRDKSLPFRERWKKMMHPKGLPPRQWMVLTRRHAGYLWPAHFIKPYVLLVFSSAMTARARFFGHILGAGEKSKS